MTRTLKIGAAAALTALTLSGASLGTTTEAQAGNGGAFIGGLAVGAIAGAALTHGAYANGYYRGPAYVYERPVRVVRTCGIVERWNRRFGYVGLYDTCTGRWVR